MAVGQQTGEFEGHLTSVSADDFSKDLVHRIWKKVSGLPGRELLAGRKLREAIALAVLAEPVCPGLFEWKQALTSRRHPPGQKKTAAQPATSGMRIFLRRQNVDGRSG
jgi:hypothetical protein